MMQSFDAAAQPLGKQSAMPPHPNRKLTQAQADAIRQRHKAGELYKVLSADYNVSIMAICRIVGNRTYRSGKSLFLSRA